MSNPIPVEVIKNPPPKVADILLYVEKLVQDHRSELDAMPDPIYWLMKDTTNHYKGGMSPIFLRPLCSIVFYGRDTVPALLERVLYETTHMKIILDTTTVTDLPSGETREEIDELEAAARKMIDDMRSRHSTVAKEDA